MYCKTDSGTGKWLVFRSRVSQIVVDKMPLKQRHCCCIYYSQQTLTLKNNAPQSVKVRLEIRSVSESGNFDYQVGCVLYTHCLKYLCGYVVLFIFIFTSEQSKWRRYTVFVRCVSACVCVCVCVCACIADQSITPV